MARIPSVACLRAINSEYGCNLSYSQWQRRLAAGLVPAERDAAGRYWLDDANLPMIAAKLGGISGRVA